MASKRMTLQNGAYFWMPFYGPLPCSGSPMLKLIVYSVAGTCKVRVAFQTNLVDATDVSYTLKRGYNTIYIPDCQGKDFLAIGIRANPGTANKIILSGIDARVQRYLATSQMPDIPARHGFTLRVGDGAVSSHKLANCTALYRDRFWF